MQKRPRLLSGPVQPFPAHFSHDLLVGDDPTRFAVRHTLPDGLHHIEVVQHVVQTAIVWQAVEKSPYGVFGRHRNLAQNRRFEYTTDLANQPSFDRSDSLLDQLANVANEPCAAVTGSHKTVGRDGSICVLDGPVE